MQKKVQWGGKIDMVELEGDYVEARIWGTFQGIVTAEAELRIPHILILRATDILQDTPLLVDDKGTLSARILEKARAELAAEGTDGVVTVDGISLRDRDGEPIRRAAAAARPPDGGVPGHAPAPGAPPAGGVDQTAFANPAAMGPALPFQQGASAPELTVEQYASLCAERALNPQAVGTVAQRYRVLTAEALQALDAQWHQRFSADGALYQRWQQAYAQYEAWLRSRR